MTISILLPPELEAKLREQAALLGKDVAVFVRETVEEKLASLPEASHSPAQRAYAWDAWVAHMRQWGRSNLPADHVVDDSRESIYEGRGE